MLLPKDESSFGTTEGLHSIRKSGVTTKYYLEFHERLHKASEMLLLSTY